MSYFVIMNVGTESLYKRPGEWGPKHYSTEHGAKIACAKINKNYGSGKQWVVKSREEFDLSYNPMVEVKSLMSGKTCMIRKEDVGTGVDPSTETYWSR